LPLLRACQAQKANNEIRQKRTITITTYDTVNDPKNSINIKKQIRK